MLIVLVLIVLIIVMFVLVKFLIIKHLVCVCELCRCVEGGWEGGGVYHCTHLVWFVHKRLPWFFILKSLSLCVLHELL